MASAEDRELRRHILRFLDGTRNGRENSRVLFMMLIDIGYRITWREFDRAVLYLERAKCIEVQDLAPEVSPARIISITQRGLDIYQGTVKEDGIMPPPPRQD